MFVQAQTGTCPYGNYANCSLCSGCPKEEAYQIAK